MRRKPIVACRELVEYRHSYYYFLSRYNFPAEVFPKHTSPSPANPQKSVTPVGDVDLRKLNLDPRNWKQQDHYLLLGLQERRHQATSAEIKNAYRSRILQYHPDKQSQQGGSDAEDDIFKCIQHAYQVLSDPARRREYDSVDIRAFDESIPSEDAVRPANDVDAFLAIYRPVFQRNARFSRRTPVPDIGNASSPREEVEAFYAFWSTFESWRTFDYLDEEEGNGSAENREDRRWIERKNRANRLRRKNEDNARLRKLFEQAYRLDPRMARFREDDRLRKEAAKMEREMIQLRLAEEKEKRRQQEERQRQEAEERQTREREEQRRQIEAIEAKSRRDRKALKKLLLDNLYFVDNVSDVSAINERSLLVEKLLLRLTNTETVTEQVQQRIDRGEQSEIIPWLTILYHQYYPPSNEAKPQPAVPSLAESQKNNPSNANTTSQRWTLVETDTLIKAVKAHPGGRRDRWNKIAEWYNRHISHLNDSSLPVRSPDELIQHAQELRQVTTEDNTAAVPLEAQTDYRALQKKRDPRIDQAAPTIVIPEAEAKSTWTPEEQKSLERGLRDTKGDDPDRWEKIANIVGRSKKECIQRAKEIAQLLKMRKMAGNS